MPKKKKLSKYNRHIAREMKGGKKTMKQAAASWRAKQKSPKKKTSKKTTRSRKTTTRKQTTRRRRRKPRGQKVLFPMLNRMLFKGGPIRTKLGSFWRR